MNNQYDICIIGAGIAGATIGSLLARQGKKIAVIERDMGERDVIIGELLQPGGAMRLREMGFEHFLDGIDAQPVTGYGMFYKDEQYSIEYPLDKNALPGFGFRNGKFLQNIRKELLTYDNVDVLEGRATRLIWNDDRVSGVEYTANDTNREHEVKAALTIVCDGPMSKFREPLSEPDKKVNGYFLGMILEEPDVPYPGHGHLFMGDHPAFVIYPVTSNHWRVLIDFKKDNPPKFGPGLKTYLTENVLPHVHASIKPSFEKAIEKGEFSSFPNHRLPANPKKVAGAVLLGDALNMRHPLTGGGMTAVFADVKNLGEQLEPVTDFNDEKALGHAVKTYYETRHLGNQTINILADALYGVVYHPNLREAFFNYLKQGGKYAEEPLGILAGIVRDKWLLQKHFFAVAGFDVEQKLKVGNLGSIKSGFSDLKDAVKIIGPLLLTEKPDSRTKLLLKMLS